MQSDYGLARSFEKYFLVRLFFFYLTTYFSLNEGAPLFITCDPRTSNHLIRTNNFIPILMLPNGRNYKKLRPKRV